MSLSICCDESYSAVIYVIDDDSNMRMAMTELLKLHLECEILSFDNGIDLIKSIKRDRPGCLVTDYKMPGMSGLELQQELVNRDIHFPIIFVSGHADISVAVTAMEHGAISFVEKPVDAAELIRKLEIALASSIERFEYESIQVRARELLGTITRDEMDVIGYILAGKLNKQIASLLDISLRTVERRKSSIYSKTDCYSAVELAKIIQRANLKIDESSFAEDFGPGGRNISKSA